MSILRPCVLALTLLATILPAIAQSDPQTGVSQHPRSSNVFIGNQVQVGATSLVIINGQGYDQPRPPVIPATTGTVSNTNCHRSVLGNPLPSHYPKGSVTGKICH